MNIQMSIPTYCNHSPFRVTTSIKPARTGETGDVKSTKISTSSQVKNSDFGFRLCRGLKSKLIQHLQMTSKDGWLCRRKPGDALTRVESIDLMLRFHGTEGVF